MEKQWEIVHITGAQRLVVDMKLKIANQRHLLIIFPGYSKIVS